MENEFFSMVIFNKKKRNRVCKKILQQTHKEGETIEFPEYKRVIKGLIKECKSVHSVS